VGTSAGGAQMSLPKLSRQQKYVRKMLKQKRCVSCGRPAVGARYCQEHLNADSARKREKLGLKKWRRGHRGRPTIASLNRDEQRAEDYGALGRK